MISPLQPSGTQVAPLGPVRPSGRPVPGSVQAPQAHQAPGDRVQVSGAALVQEAEVPEQAAAPAAAAPAPRAVAPGAPDVLLQEGPASTGTEDWGWVMDAASQSAYADEPALQALTSRLEHLPTEVREAVALPLLDALTTAEPDQARKALEDLAGAAAWAQKFKKDARAAVAEGGSDLLLQKAREASQPAATEAGLLDGVLAAPSLRFSGPLSEGGVKEAEHLLEQFQAGNTNPGIGSKTLGKGVSYLRGRKGTRLFYRMEEGKPAWLAVCDKSTEDKAIAVLRRELDLR